MPPSLSPIISTCQALKKRQTAELAWIIGQFLAAMENYRRGPLPKEVFQQLADDLRTHGIELPVSRLHQFLSFYRLFPDRQQWYPELSWTHYTYLLRLQAPPARRYYLQQAAFHHWSTRELRRQIRAQSFERWQQRGQADKGRVQSIAQLIRETYVLEFAKLSSLDHLLERDLEQALLDHLQYFLLELGSGFAFVARQKRIFTETGKQFFIDLVFYHVLHQCYVLIDLKTGELSHRDIGQMDMYIRLYDHKYRSPRDAPTVGIILCSEKDPSLVKYSMLWDSPQLFASTYILYLPQDLPDQ